MTSRPRSRKIVYHSKSYSLFDLIFSQNNGYSKISQLLLYDKEFGVLGMVKIKFLEVKLQNFVKIAHYCALRQERVNIIHHKAY